MRDGSRLKNAWIDMPGGLRTPAYGPWDSQLRLLCRKEHDQAGDERCFPEVHSAFIRFLDDDCKQPVLDSGANERLAPGTMVRVNVTIDCEVSKTRIFRVGPVLPPVQTWSRPGDIGRCRGPSAPGAGRTLYRMGEEVPSSTFVKYHQRTLPGRGPLRPWVREGEDGSVLEWGWLDLETGQECYPAIAADGQVRCLPHEGGEIWPFFSDPACRDRAFIGRPGCHAKAFARAAVPGCPARETVRWRVPADTAYARRDGQCVGRPRLRGELLFGLGPEIPADHFPPFEERIGSLPGRLQPVFVGAGDWEEHREFQDSKLGERCWSSVLGTSPTCIPRPTNALTFADAACQTPLAEVAEDECPPRYAVVPSEPYNRTQAYELGAAHQGQPLFRRNDERCEPAPARSGVAYFDLRPLRDGTFAPITGRWITPDR